MVERTSKPPMRWRTALLLSAAANYGPFVVVALLALKFVSSSHARRTIWELAPCGTAFLATDQLYRTLNIPGNNDWLMYGHSLALTLFIVVGLAWVLRKAHRVGFLALAACGLWCSYGAIVLMALLQMSSGAGAVKLWTAAAHSVLLTTVR